MSDLAQAVSMPDRGATSSFGEKWGSWRTALLLCLVGWLYAPILGRLAQQWWADPNFSHGFFVPVFSAFVMWQDRFRLAAVPRKPSTWGLPVILLALSMLVLGVFGAELFLSRLSLIALAGGLVIFFLGWEMFRAVFFPLLFSILMVPIPAIPLEVAEACSGIRSLLSLTTLAIMYGYLMETRPFIRTMLALASIPIAVAANGFRIIGTGLLVQYWDPDKAEGFFHAFSGWLIFVVSLLMLFLLHQLLNLLAPDRRSA